MADAHDPFPACDVCGRTILKGEQIHEYLTPSRERIRVCVLCRSRAESSGWIPVAMAHTIDEEEPRRSRGHALRQRLGRVAARARSTRGRRAEGGSRDADLDAAMGRPNEGAWPPSPDDEQDAGIAAGLTEHAPHEAAPPRRERESDSSPRERSERTEPRQEPTSAARARRPARPREPRQARPPASPPRPAQPRPARRAKRGPEALMRRAVERFNASEERRKVAGLIRSLGEPQAGVRPDPRRQLALVTVAWELSWYQWEVGADGDGDDGGPVREVGKGAEVSELDEEARSWNASVDEDGTLRLRAAAEQPRQAAQEA